MSATDIFSYRRVLARIGCGSYVVQALSVTLVLGAKDHEFSGTGTPRLELGSHPDADAFGHPKGS